MIGKPLEVIMVYVGQSRLGTDPSQERFLERGMFWKIVGIQKATCYVLLHTDCTGWPSSEPIVTRTGSPQEVLGSILHPQTDSSTS